MGLFTKKVLGTLDDLLVEQIEDLYDAELRLTKALPKMAAAAGTKELQVAFTSHLGETEEQVQRLERVFEQLGKDARRETCEGIKGLISEGSETIDAEGDTQVKDAALIAAAQRIEHYEMAGYGTARTLAEQLGHTEVARLLQQTLDEEGAADKKLTKIAEGSIYKSKAPENGRSKGAGNGKAKSSKGKSSSKAGAKTARSSTKGSAAGGKKSKGRKRATAKA